MCFRQTNFEALTNKGFGSAWTAERILVPRSLVYRDRSIIISNYANMQIFHEKYAIMIKVGLMPPWTKLPNAREVPVLAFITELIAEEAALFPRLPSGAPHARH